MTVSFEPGFDVTPSGVSFVARVDGQLVACRVTSHALAETEGSATADVAMLRRIFTRHQESIRRRMVQKIAQGAAEPDRTFCLHSGEL